MPLRLLLIPLLLFATVQAADPKPYEWPREGEELELDKKYEYGDDFQFYLRKKNRETGLEIYYKGQLVEEFFWPVPVHYWLLKTGTTWPVFETWGDRTEPTRTVSTRLLVGPIYYNEVFSGYAFRYIEDYTDKKPGDPDPGIDITSPDGTQRTVVYLPEESDTERELEEALNDARRAPEDLGKEP